MIREVKNTDTELWRGNDDGGGDYYADRVFVTARGGIGFDVGGTVIVKTPRAWIDLAQKEHRADSRMTLRQRLLYWKLRLRFARATFFAKLRRGHD
jgi:hypothetical protein